MARAPGAAGGGEDEGIIVEFQRVGAAVKVSAVDTRTYEEVSIVCPASATEREMTDAVLKKLVWVQSRRKGPAGSRGSRH